MSRHVLDRLAPYAVSTHSYRGDDTCVVDKARILEVLTFLRNEPDLSFDFPTDLTVVDHIGREPRFEVVYQLRSTKHKHRVRIKAPVSEEDATIHSATPLFSGWNWFEREAFDMYGIKFEGHPNLKRMFMYDQFVGHPLRKDYPVNRRQPLIGPVN
jgi:NADH-quinone oxidoreductase subunit C